MSQFLLPVPITDAVLLSSSVSETDHPAWSVVGVYAVGDRVVRTSVHRVFERLTAGGGTLPPEQDPAAWADAGPTNRWRMFDGDVGTATTAAEKITVTLKPGVVQSIFLGVVDADYVSAVMTYHGTEVWRRDLSAVDIAPPVNDWWTYYYGAVRSRKALIIDGLPAYSDATITIEIGGGDEVSVGMLAVGTVEEIGGALDKPNTGGSTFAKITESTWGSTSITPGKSVRTMTLSLLVSNENYDSTAEALEKGQQTPGVWIGSMRFDSLIIWGICVRWYGVVSGGSSPGAVSQYNVEIKGIILENG